MNWKRLDKCPICGHERCSYTKSKGNTIGWCFREQRSFLIEKNKHDIPEPPPKAEDIRKRILSVVENKMDRPTIDWPKDYVIANDVDSYEYHYLIARGVEPWQIRVYQLGTSPECQDRIIIPEPTPDKKKLFYYTARGLDSSVYPRYKNPEDVSPGVFNLHAASTHGTIVVCEGGFSAMAVGRNAVALYGNSLTDRQAEIILSTIKAKEHNIIICLDGGYEKEAMKIAAKLYGYFHAVSVALLPGKQDPAEVGKDVLMKCLYNAMPYSKISPIVTFFKEMGG